MGQKDPDKKPLKDRICNDVLARVCYQVSLTVLIVGTILLIILIIQVLLPYLKVSKYHWTTCRVENSTLANDPMCYLQKVRHC